MILTPDKLWARVEVLSKPCPVPREGGLYGWYFDAVPPGIVAANHHIVGKASLLYVGISPKAAITTVVPATTTSTAVHWMAVPTTLKRTRLRRSRPIRLGSPMKPIRGLSTRLYTPL